jgi:putative peptidoglycan lipid II flippase
MFGVAIGAAVLPALSRSISEAGQKVDAKASREIISAIDLVIWLTVPCLVFLLESNLFVIQLFYQAGHYTAADTAATSSALQAYAWGLVAYGLLKVMTSYYYAVDRTRYAMGVSLLSIAVNYIFNAVLVKTHGHVGLAMTTSVTLTLNALLLIVGMIPDKVQVPWPKIVTSVALLTSAALMASGLQLFASPLTTLVSGIVGGWLQGGEVATTLAVKTSALGGIIVNGVIVAGVFGIFAMIRLKTTPQGLLEQAKQFRRRR